MLFTTAYGAMSSVGDRGQWAVQKYKMRQSQDKDYESDTRGMTFSKDGGS